MFTCCWSAKGGSGVTVVAAALALTASCAAPTTIIDLCGDLPAALGVADPVGPGVAEWSRGPHEASPASSIVPITATLSLLPRGRGPMGTLRHEPLAELAGDVIVDAGCLDRPGGPRSLLASRAPRSLLVTRPCYLALRRTVQLALRPHGIVVISEPGRSLHAGDVAAVVGAPVVAEVPFDPSIARALDAGLLVSRCPSALFGPLGATR